MRYARIVETLVAKRWMITREMHSTMCALVQSKLAQGLRDPLEKPTLEDRGRNVFTGEELPKMEIQNGVAVIPVVGVLANRVGLIEKSCGVTDYQDIRRDLDAAGDDESVSSVVLDIRSPGGTVTGCYETADKVAEIASRKPVVAYSDDMICSGAYYLAAPCTAIVSTSSAEIGSIGCILQILDDVSAWEKSGYKVETFKSDEMKAVGASGTRITEAQRVYLQEIVDEAGNRFKNWVSHHRSIGVGSVMDGRVLSTEKALAEGLVDRLVGSIADAIALAG